MEARYHIPKCKQPLGRQLEDAALGYVRRGYAVLPCQPDKTPHYIRGLLEHGCKDASTDPERVRRLWSRYPTARVGLATGWRFFVVDVDGPEGLESLARLEAEHGKLPTTRTVRTPRGGLHLYFALPPGVEIRNSAGDIAPSVDVRGRGGHVVAPPSPGYRFEVRTGMADPPPWLLARLREPVHRLSEAPTRIKDNSVNLESGGPIPERTRNDTLTRICGRLHDGTRNLAQLKADLMAVNEERCEPPVTEAEVDKIAQSIHKTEPCKAAPEITPEVRETLERIEGKLWREDWPGMGGKSERDVYATLILAARRCGTLIPAGVRVSIDVRSLALAAAVSKRALLDARKNGERKPGILSRLKMRGMVRSDNAERSGTNSGAFVLLLPRAEFHHSPTGGGSTEPGVASGETLRAPRLRWSAPEIRRLGKTRGALIDTLQRAGGTLTLAELAATAGIKRGRDLRRRLLPDLETAGVVECFGDIVSLTGDWSIALKRACEISGESAAMRRDMVRYNLQREGYRNRHKRRPTPHVANLRPDRVADGVVSELERVRDPDRALLDALKAFLRRNPHRTNEAPSWLAVALWAEEYLPSKPPPEVVEVALADLRREAA